METIFGSSVESEKMRAAGVPDETIAGLTGLSVGEVSRI